MRVRSGLKQALISASLLALLTACMPTSVERRGFVPEQEKIEKLKAGTDTRATVEETLGTPSAKATFDDDTWYYISDRTETVAFFDAEVLERTVLAIVFDDNGNVKDIGKYGAKDGKIIEFVARKTPTKGKELTFLEQMFGNLGRFSGGGNDKGPGGGGR